MNPAYKTNTVQPNLMGYLDFDVVGEELHIPTESLEGEIDLEEFSIGLEA